MSPSCADRNLLFGILALQLDFIRQDALIAAMHAWVLDKAKPLGHILVEQGHLSSERRRLLDSLVAERGLATIAPPQRVLADLRAIADDELHASLAQLPAGDDALSTTAAPATAEDEARFQILRPHASGGLGDVFVAQDSELNREVALKEIQARHADHPHNRARFVREAEITGGLEHPGIVPVYALGQHADGRPYYAMRFIRGDSLKQAIDRHHSAQRPEAERNLELRQLLARFIAVCNAIAYAHSRGVLHRDLKPANIMLGEFGETLVVDWGLAKVIGQPDELHLDGTAAPALSASDSAELTRPGQALGTPAYMSPEQAAGRLDQMGPASDVYSLGATLYHLLTGEAPFGKSDLGEVLNQVQRGDFAPPRRVNRQVPAALEAICLKAMARQPHDRYASAKALADDLEHWLADEAVPAHAEPWTARLGRWVRHHKGLVGTALAVAVLVVTVGIAGWLLQSASDRAATEQELRREADTQRTAAEKNEQEARTQRQRADRYLYFSRINLAHRAWQEAHIARLDELLAQTQPARAVEDDLPGFERNYLLRLRQNCLLTLKGHTSIVYSVAFSPDGQRIASASGSTVKVWDARTGQETLTLKGHTGICVAFSPDGQRLAAATSGANTVRVWDARTGEETLTLKGHTSEVKSVAFSPDGQRLASASWDKTMKVWDARTGQESLTLKGHTEVVRSVVFSPDGHRLASASYDQTVKLWDARTGEEVLTLKGHSERANCVAFSPDGQRLASASEDQTVKVWDASTGQETLTLKGHTSSVRSVVFSPDGQRLASASPDQTVKVWDARTGQETLTLKGHTGMVESVAFSPDGQRLASASRDQTAKVWEAHTGQENLTLKGHTSNVYSVTFSPDGQRLASASWDQTVKVWDARIGQETLTLRGHTSGVTSVAFSPDGQRLASASYDQTVKVWDARTGQEVLTFKGHTDGVRSVVFSPDGQRLASASYDQTVKVWDARTGQENLTLKGHGGNVYRVTFSPDGQRLASASYDKAVKVWDVRTGQETLTLRGHTSVAFSPDGQRLASVSLGQTVKVWDASTGQETLSLQGHTQGVESVAFSPDGHRIVSASADNTVKVWDARTGQESLTLKGHAGNVTCVAFSPDGHRLASASSDRTVRIWDATLVSEESNRQHQALNYFRFVAETVVLKDDMLQQIRQTPTLSEPVREQALAFAKDYREIPARLNEASWSVVRWSWARPGAYALALRQAEAACREEPSEVIFLRTFGAAQYRAGDYAAALKTLPQYDQRTLDNPRYRDFMVRYLPFLAMTQFQLGQKPEAAASLGRLRNVMKHWPPDREAEELLQEAESLIDPKK